MQKIKTSVSPDLVARGIIGANTVEFSHADPVYVNSSGLLAIGQTGGSGKLLGFCYEDKTTTSTNSTVAKYKPQFIPGFPFVKVVYPSDIDAEQVHIGGTNDFTSGSATGTFTIDLTASTQGSAGNMFIWERDPYGENDNDVVLVSIAEPQYLTFAQP